MDSLEFPWTKGTSVTIPEFAATVIASFEGCELKAYQDGGGVWTIGYGHTGPEIGSGHTITQAQALEYLQSDIQKVLKYLPGKPILEAGAYASFGYNCGEGALQQVLAGKTQLLAFDHIHGVPNAALLRRRQFEAALIEISQMQGKVG